MTGPYFKSFTRLAEVYKIVESTHRLSLDRAVAKLRQIEVLIEQQCLLARTATLLGREALIHENSIKWLECESQIEVIIWNLGSLESLRGKCNRQKDHIEDLYRKSLLQYKQVEIVVEKARVEIDLTAKRQNQLESDDRYLSQLGWRARHGARRMKEP
jgi:hypothetical protein